MYESTKHDHARIQMNNISRFGLLEMSRQRIKPALNDLMGKTIWVRSIASVCESIFRLVTEKSINNRSSILLLKVSPNVANELLNRYRNNLAEIEMKFGTKIMTFIDPYKQNDNYTIEIKKNAYFDYEANLEESSLAFQNKSSYNLKVPKKKSKALVEDVEFRNKPNVDANKKGLLDSLFNFFKSEEKTEKPKKSKKYSGKPRRSNQPQRVRKPRNFKSDSKRNDQTRKDQPRKTSAKPNRSVKKPVNGNLKSRPENTPAPLPDDNIGNRVEAPKDKPKRRAKNDPRAKN
jgi:ribonuclease E